MIKQYREVTGLILCGGRGSRLGFKDKGLETYGKKKLIQHMIDRVKPQVDQLLININQNQAQYEVYGEQLITDGDNNFQGPLAGILSAAAKIETEFCFVVPCDMPHIPLDTVSRLQGEIDDHPAVAVSNQGRVQPLVLLLRTAAIESITDRLQCHNKSVMGWLESIDYISKEFVDPAPAFINLNQPEAFR